MEFMTDDDIEMFFETWMKFDPAATEAVAYSRLSMFFDALKPPLRVPVPNQEHIVAMDVTISQSRVGDDVDLVHIDDAFSALVGFFLNYHFHVVNYRPSGGAFYKFRQVSSTQQRRREAYCSTLVQESYR